VVSPVEEGTPQAVRFRRCSVIWCWTNWIESWSGAVTTLCVMRRLQHLCRQRTSGPASDGERYALITHRLKLKVNRRRAPWLDRGKGVLGFSFTSEREPRRRIAPKAIARCKERIREQTRRTRGIS